MSSRGFILRLCQDAGNAEPHFGILAAVQRRHTKCKFKLKSLSIFRTKIFYFLKNLYVGLVLFFVITQYIFRSLIQYNKINSKHAETSKIKTFILEFSLD